jgi:hypothetical protein
MSEKCSCDIAVNGDNQNESNFVCRQLYVVDEAKTDMEFRCLYK